MQLSLLDLGLWAAASAVILIITSEVISPYYGRINLTLRLKPLRHVAFGLLLLFVIIAALKIATITYTLKL